MNKRLLQFALAIVALLAGVLGSQALFAAQGRPRLVVMLVLDGLPQWQALAYRDQLQPDGLARFLDRGAWFSQAHHGHALTVTASGHAAMLTGAYANRSGIIGNEWRDRDTGQPQYCVGDSSASYIGHPTKPLDGTSPRNLKVQAVGDVLRGASPGSKVIAISGKDRGAILLAGHRGTAYVYMSDTGQFASSSYYMKEHPAWVNAFNARRPADRYFKAEWKPLLPEAAYARSVPDNQPWFGPGGGKLPMMMGAPRDDAPNAAFYAGLLHSPFADALALDFARAALDAEQLGQDDSPDILAISLSAHDYVNHLWGAEARLSHDHLLQTDKQLQAFFQDLDRKVGPNNYVAVLSSDHGFMPAPQYSEQRGIASPRFSGGQVLARVNAQLQQRFGVARLVPFTSASTLVIDRNLLARHGLALDAVAEAARGLLQAEDSVAAAYTRHELQAGSRSGAPFFEAMRRSWHQELSGDVMFVFKPFWTSSRNVATHGSPHEYDTHVPIMLWGPRWVKPGRIDSRVLVVDIAPTIARLLGVNAPSTNEGRLLPFAAP